MSKLDEMEKILDAIDTTKEYDAKISAIEEGVGSNEYYKSTRYDNREGVVLTFKLKNPIGDLETWDEFFAVPDTSAMMNPKSKIALFYTRYGKPVKDLKVKGRFNEEGFLRVVL